jgi:ADP-ribose pyrophosphatase
MKSWRKLSSRIILENSWIKIRKDEVMLPSGKSGEYTYLENLPFVMIVGISKRGWIMVRQFRYTIQQITIEFPAGSIEGNETALAAAKRELKEETGYVAGKWTKAGVIHESLSTNKTHGTVYLAEELTETSENGMADEGIDKCLFLSEDEIVARIGTSEITDAKAIASFFLAKQMLQNR